MAPTPPIRYNPDEDPDPVRLDWRNGSNKNACMAKLHRLLEQAASTSAVKMTLWGSNVQKLDLATDRYVHAGRETEKKFESVSGIKYYPALYHVAEALFQILDKQEPMLKRRFGYHLKETEFSAIQAERIWMDIALTIREHPFALGVVSDSEGMFSTPNGWQLEVVRCVNILQYLNSDKDGDVPPGCQKMVLRNTSAEAIPSTIVRLDLRSSSGSGVDPLRAVVVMEHRNAKMTIDIASRKGKGNFKGVLFVLTGGFSDIATREFLHLLSLDTALTDVPFLFYSDHDAHAVQIFHTLRQGSKNLAFASDSLVCPRLIWAGPTKEHYLAIARKWPEVLIEQETTLHPGRTEAEKDARRAALLQDINKDIEAKFNSKGSKANAGDRARIKHFDNVMPFENQPVVRDEVELLRHGNKFALTELSKHHQWGMEECLNIIVAEALLEVPEPIVNLNPIAPASFEFARRVNSRSQLRPDSQDDSLPSSEPMPGILGGSASQHRSTGQQEQLSQMTEEDRLSFLAEMKLSL